jgi:predicted DNA-binding protein
MSEGAMVRTQVYLTGKQKQELERLAASTGRRQSDMIREAIDGYLAQHEPKDWREALESVCGMWADRDDLDQLYGELRAEVEDRLDRLAGICSRR